MGGRPYVGPQYTVFCIADGGTRTHDPSITNRKLYQLSYIGVAAFFAALRAVSVENERSAARTRRSSRNPAELTELDLRQILWGDRYAFNQKVDVRRVRDDDGRGSDR